MQRWLGDAFTLPAHILSHSGDTWGLVAIAGVGWWLWGRSIGHGVITAVALSTVVWLALNAAFDVARPEAAAGIDVHDELEIGSFPSGHVQQAAAAWGLLYARGVVPLAAAAVIVLLVALARLQLGAHFVADVAVAVPIGMLLVLLVQQWGRMTRRRFTDTSWLWPAIWGVSLLAVVLVPVLGLGDDARRWEATGVIAGALVALPLEARFVRFEGSMQRRLHRYGAAAVGLAGVAAFAVADALLVERGKPAGGVLIALAVIWAWCAWPAVLHRIAAAGDRR